MIYHYIDLPKRNKSLSALRSDRKAVITCLSRLPWSWYMISCRSQLKQEAWSPGLLLSKLWSPGLLLSILSPITMCCKSGGTNSSITDWMRTITEQCFYHMGRDKISAGQVSERWSFLLSSAAFYMPDLPDFMVIHHYSSFRLVFILKSDGKVVAFLTLPYSYDHIWDLSQSHCAILMKKLHQLTEESKMCKNSQLLNKGLSTSDFRPCYKAINTKSDVAWLSCWIKSSALELEITSEIHWLCILYIESAAWQWRVFFCRIGSIERIRYNL